MSRTKRTNLFFKVVVEHDPEEKPERLAEEIRQRLLKFYGGAIECRRGGRVRTPPRLRLS